MIHGTADKNVIRVFFAVKRRFAHTDRLPYPVLRQPHAGGRFTRRRRPFVGFFLLPALAVQTVVRVVGHIDELRRRSGAVQQIVFRVVIVHIVSVHLTAVAGNHDFIAAVVINICADQVARNGNVIIRFVIIGFFIVFLFDPCFIGCIPES